jgi:tetraprenyl-beta-curcumene synthase
MITNFIFKVFPLVSRELDYWGVKAEQIPDWELRAQALASIRSKKFHAQGGSVYALYQGKELAPTVRFIVALQTISDYLDNLCDRVGVMDEQAFFQLHLAMSDAVDPERSICDYYRYYPVKNDQGYLEKLVTTCRRQIRNQPSYHLVLPKIAEYVQRYSKLQSYKHLALEIRENRLRDWAQKNLNPATAIYWWEYAAATGSTLGMFLLFAIASNPALTSQAVAGIDEAYFPWVTGLHILLDYFIDADEDLKMGDYNFTTKYETGSECLERLTFFIEQSIKACRHLPHPRFHLTVIKGLLAMYLSDPKALTPEIKENSLCLVRRGGPKSRLYHIACCLLRAFNKL